MGQTDTIRKPGQPDRYRAVARVLGPDGRKHRVSCGVFEQEWEADLAWQDREAAAEPDAGAAVEPGSTLAQYLDGYCRAMAGSWAKSTVKTNATVRRALTADPIGRVPVAEVSKRDVNNAFTRWAAAGDSASVIAQRWKMVRAVLHDAVENKARTDAVPRKVNVPTVAKGTKRGKALDAGQVAALLDGAGKIDPTWREFVLVSIECGLRQGEAAALSPEQFLPNGLLDVDRVFERDGTLRPYPKDGDPRLVPVPSHVAKALAPYIRRARLRGAGAPLFTMPESDSLPVLYDRWRHVLPSIRQASGLRRTGITHKDFRHTFTTHYLNAGVPIDTVRQWLGHASEDTTKGYGHGLTTEETLAWGRFASGEGPDPRRSR